MSSRKAPDNGEETTAKRQRIGDDVNHVETADMPSFHDLNTDCLASIMLFLSSNDMNSFSKCNRDCSVARRSETLDQTSAQRGTIIVMENTTVASFWNKLTSIQSRNIFSGKRTCLRIEGLGRMTLGSYGGIIEQHDPYLLLELAEVMSLDCSCEAPMVEIKGDVWMFFNLLSRKLGNLQSLDLSNLEANFRSVIGSFINNCPDLTKVKWNGCQDIFQHGHELEQASKPTQLYIDGAVFSRYVRDDDTRLELARDHPNSYLLERCSRLERLSLKGASVKVVSIADSPVPILQEALIKMVRRHPTLRWLRSDLSHENVALLEQERPEITFVSK